VILALAGFAATVWLVPVVRYGALKRRLVDWPDQARKRHGRPVPRLGGVAIFVVFILQVGLWFILRDPENVPMVAALVVSAAAMFAIGLWDDVRPLGARRKLLFQILVAGVAYLMGVRVEQFFWVEIGLWGLPLTVLWLVGTTNIINLIDGIDGLAAGVSLFLMLTLGILSRPGQDLSPICFGMVGVLLGFLVFNFPPARIFLGDGGAYFLGYLIGAIALLNSNKGEVAAAMVAPFLALGLPVLDASLTIARRTVRGTPLFFGDRDHIHHRLIDIGLSHQRAVIILYLACAILSFGGIIVFYSKGRLLPVVLGVAFGIALVIIQQLGYVKRFSRLGGHLGSNLLHREEMFTARDLLALFRQVAAVQPDLAGIWKYLDVVLDRLGFSNMEFVSKQPGGPASHRWECLLPMPDPGLLGGRHEMVTVRLPIARGHDRWGELVLSRKIAPGEIAHYHRLCDLIAQELSGLFAGRAGSKGS